MIGKQVAHYEITAKIGEGGMGEVYRATDTKLNREVALKILPEQFAIDAQRMGRFQREAEVLASLDHPNIGAIHGIEDVGTTKALVLQLIEGPTLADRIAEGPVPSHEALPIALQIAEALEAAHEKGIVHRDLKPANIKLTPDGQVKVLDFGLAKIIVPEPESDDARTVMATQAWAVLGTASYMSPEQARGESIDRRTDVWAFGCVLYELLTGSRAFEGRTAADTIAQVLESSPDWNKLSEGTPARVVWVLRRCLEPDTARRLRDLGDVGMLLEEAPEFALPGPRAGLSGPVIGALIGAVGGALLVWAAAAALGGGSVETAGPQTRLELMAPELGFSMNSFGSPPFSISDDGRRVAYVATDINGLSMLKLRSMDGFNNLTVSGTEGATDPFFSPDGQSLGFFVVNELRRIPIAGGVPTTLYRSDAAFTPMGATWTSQGRIVFGAERQGLLSVSEDGGDFVQLTVPDTASGELHHGFPQALPDGDHILFTAHGGLGTSASLAVLSQRDKTRRSLQLGDTAWMSQPHYLKSGHLVYSFVDRLLVAPFNLTSYQIEGPARVAVQDLHYDVGAGTSFYDVSPNGTLVYQSTIATELVQVDRQGLATLISGELGYYIHPRVSPDGKRIIFVGRKGADRDIWLYDLTRDSLERLTLGGNNAAPVWAPDGRRVTFAWFRPGGAVLAFKRSDTADPPEVLFGPDEATGERPATQPSGDNWPMGWGPDGQVLAFEKRTEDQGLDIWLLRLDGRSRTEPFITTNSNDESPRFSPDGALIAYVSDFEGQYEVYVTPFPEKSQRWKISRGGTEPVWNSSGSELFYKNGDTVMQVDVSRRPELSFSRPKPLFSGTYNRSNKGHAHFDVAPDAQSFFMVREEKSALGRLKVVTGWIAELERLTASE